MRQRRHVLQVSTFPFLAVLLCAMGSLILLLLVIDRRAKAVTRLKAQQAAARLAAEDAQVVAQRAAELEQRRRALHEQLQNQDQGVLAEVRTVQHQVDTAGQGLRAEESRGRDLKMKRDEETVRLTREGEAIRARQAEVARTADQTKASQKELAQLALDLTRLENTLADLKAARQRDQRKYSLVPYRGKRGADRRPIYVECVAMGLIFHPDRKAMYNFNTSASSLRAEVESRITQRHAADPGGAGKDQTPYLLMLVRPEGIMTYHRAQAALSGLKIEFGYEFVEADWILDFSETEDAIPQPWKTAAGTAEHGAPSGEQGKGVPRAGIPITAKNSGEKRGAGVGGQTGSSAPGQGEGGTGGDVPSLALPLIATEKRGVGPPVQSGGGQPGVLPFAQGGGGVGGVGLSPGSPGPGGLGVPGSGDGGQPGFSALPSRGSNGGVGGVAPLPGGGEPFGSAGPRIGNQGATAPVGPGGVPGGSGGIGLPGTGGSGPDLSVTSPLRSSGQIPSLTPGGEEGFNLRAPLPGEHRPEVGPSLAPSQGVGLGRPSGQGGPGRSDPPAPGTSFPSGGMNPGSPTGKASPDSGPSLDSNLLGQGAPGGKGTQANSSSGSSSPGSGSSARTGAIGSSSEGPQDSDPSSEGPANPPLGISFPTTKAGKPVTQLPSRANRIFKSRDLVIPIECTADGLILNPGGIRISLTELARSAPANNPLLQMVQQMIVRRQALVRPGEPPSRPIIRFSVRPDGLRAYYLAYPALESLQVPMTRENLRPEKDDKVTR